MCAGSEIIGVVQGMPDFAIGIKSLSVQAYGPSPKAFIVGIFSHPYMAFTPQI